MEGVLGKVGLLVAALVATGAVFAHPVMAEDISGDWAGKLFGNPLNVHFGKSVDGVYFGLISSQDGSVFTASDIHTTANNLHFEIPARLGVYVFDGTKDAETGDWTGTLVTRGPTPLSLTRTETRMVPKRPQEEAIYTGPTDNAENVSFGNHTTSGVRLAGTMSKPSGPGPFPTIILVAGSGPNTRDDDNSGHHTLLVLSHALNAAGFAVLRYDKRGTGGSSGAYDQATTDDFASDAEAAVDYLSSRQDVDKTKIGIVGHSEGGLIGPMVAAGDSRVKFVVSMAGPAIPAAVNWVRQAARTAKAFGRSDTEVDESAALAQKTVDQASAAQSFAAFHNRLKPLATDAVKKGLAIQSQVTAIDSVWWWNSVRVDESKSWSKVRVPILALYGTLDVQVPADDNAPAATAALKDDRDATVMVLPRLNHVFQVAGTGAQTEYDRIEETISPTALTAITDWLSTHVKASTPSDVHPN